jgi:hypothetical protein
MPHTFLSDEWLATLRQIAAEAEPGGVMPSDIEINMVVIGGPDGDRELHVADGSLSAGLVDRYPTKVTLPYTVAKKMFVNSDQAAGMQAFMSGQIKVEGDMSRLMAMQAQNGGGTGGSAMQERLRAITASDGES